MPPAWRPDAGSGDAVTGRGAAAPRAPVPSVAAPPIGALTVGALTVGALSILVAVAAPRPGVAQELGYDDSRIGQRGMGLAGAYVAVADDASAAYHNPGGLALQPAGSAAGSLAVSMLQGYRVDRGYRTALGDFDLVDDADAAVPAAFAVMVRLGEDRGGRGPDHALAVFYGEPVIVRRRFDVDAISPSGGGTTSLLVTREDRWTLYGLSYAYRPVPGVGVGLTLSLARRSFRHEEFEALSRFDGPATAPTPTLSAWRRSLASLSHMGLVLRLGGAWDVAPRWRLGVSFQPPAMPLSTVARVRSTASAIAASDGVDVTRLDAGDVERPGAESPLPWELRAGAAYQVTRTSLLSFEAGVYGRQGSADDPVRFLGDPDTVDPETGVAPRAGLYVGDAYHADVTFAAAAGTEFLVADRVPFQLGLRTHLSAAPPVPATSDVWRPDRLDGFGASFSVGLRTGGGDISVGAAGSMRWGRGLAVQEGLALGDPDAYARTDVRAWSITLFLTGSGRAAAEAASEVYDRTLRPIVGGKMVVEDPAGADPADDDPDGGDGDDTHDGARADPGDERGDGGEAPPDTTGEP